MNDKYYEITEQELTDIRAKLPFNIAFGFESFGAFFFSGKTVENINGSHGKLLDLVFNQLYGQDEETFLAAKESASYEKYLEHKDRNADGIDGYEKILGYIASLGGLGASYDTQIIPSYKLITDLRMMMKDGQFKTALRYWAVDIKPVMTFPQFALDFIEGIIVSLCLKYGDSQELLDNLISAPKGEA